MTSSCVVSVAEISDIKPHPNADKLDLAVVLGWQCVVGKGQFKPGDRVVFFPPDTVIPQELSDKFGVTKYLSNGRIKHTRLRGEPSFGLVMMADATDEIGANVAEKYGVTKWEPPVRANLGEAASPHPLFWDYTDIENLRNFPGVLQSEETVVVTEKIHGTSARVAMIEGELMAGSHHVRRKMPENQDFARSTYWFPLAIPEIKDLIDALVSKGYKQVIIYGEIYGSKIQSFDYGLPKGKIDFAVFDILVDGKYLDYEVFAALCDGCKVKRVPVLAVVPFSLEIIKKLSDGKPVFGGAHVREGVVINPIVERRDPKIGRVIFKYVSDTYLLKDKSDYKEE